MQRETNGYQTKQRNDILEYLKANPAQHLTADTITDALKQNGVSVGKTTVYRYLDKLASEGKVRRYFVPNSKSACYEFIDPTLACNLHYHLKCTGCGALLHVECGLMDQVASHMERDHSFLVDQTKTVLYGLCHDCQKSGVSNGGKSHE